MRRENPSKTGSWTSAPSKIAWLCSSSAADRYLGQDPTQAPEAQAKMPAGDSYLVVAVGDEEASAIGWRPGYYPSPLPPKEGLERLGIDPSEAVGA